MVSRFLMKRGGARRRGWPAMGTVERGGRGIRWQRKERKGSPAVRKCTLWNPGEGTFGEHFGLAEYFIVA